MYGSYPEMSISMRFMAAKFQRVMTFFAPSPKNQWPLTYENILGTAERIRSTYRGDLGNPEISSVVDSTSPV
jgi:hypothetical protein